VGGIATRRQVTQRALQKFADAGITGFVDKAGRNWNLASYAEMATRSTITQAQVQGYVDRLQANGHDLVIVSDSPAECPLCRPWAGKVLSISGRDPAHSSLDDARSTGLFHSNCTHHVGIYLPGITPDYKDTENPEGYVQKQRQRELERRVRKYKRRQAAAIDEDARRAAGKRVRQAQKTLREHVEKHDLKRLRYREQIEGGTARKTASEPTPAEAPAPRSEPPIARPTLGYEDFPIVQAMADRMQQGLPLVERTTGLVEDPIFGSMVQTAGYDGFPHVVSEQELARYVAAGETELFRGISGLKASEGHTSDQNWRASETFEQTAQRRAEEFRSGPLFLGCGGTYAAEGALAIPTAREYAGETGSLLHISIRSDARVIEDKEAERLRQAEILNIVRTPGLAPNQVAARITAIGTISTWAVKEGYDVIWCKQQSGQPTDEYIILNRTAVRVAQEDYRD
jgi:hypothetical protein